MSSPAIPEPEIGGAEVAALQQAAGRGELKSLREQLARTRQNADWQDRCFVLERVAPHCQLNVLDVACQTEPDAADLHSLRCALFAHLATEVRGGKIADKTSDQQFRDAAHCIKDALQDQLRARELDSADPVPCALVMRPLTIFGELGPRLGEAFQCATRLAPAFVQPHFTMVNAESARWGGSHEKSLTVARNAMLGAGRGSDMAACLFWAHILVWSHLLTFDKDKIKATNYRQTPGIKKELENAFDQWTGRGYKPQRSSLMFLHYAAFWFYVAQDRTRLRKAFSYTQGLFFNRPWNIIGNARDIYAKAVTAAQ